MEHLLILKKVMEKEADIYNELLSLSQQQKKAVIKNNIPSVSAVAETQRQLLASLEGLEKERASALRGYCAEQGLPEGSRLWEVIGGIRGTQREALQHLAEELRQTAAKLRQADALNRMLIETQLQYTSFCTNLLAGGENSLNTYSGSGHKNETNTVHPCLVDQVI